VITGIIIAVSQLIPEEVGSYSSLFGPEPGATTAINAHEEYGGRE
jgi:hypothetical protein